MEYIDVHTASEKWSLSERRITMLCRDGRILGAKKDGRTWLIPSDTEKPLDARTREYQDAEHAEAIVEVTKVHRTRRGPKRSSPL